MKYLFPRRMSGLGKSKLKLIKVKQKFELLINFQNLMKVLSSVCHLLTVLF